MEHVLVIMRDGVVRAIASDPSRVNLIVVDIDELAAGGTKAEVAEAKEGVETLPDRGEMGKEKKDVLEELTGMESSETAPAAN